MPFFILATAVLVAKFFAYAAYAGALNRRFGTSHHRYRVSGARMLLSLLFTGLHALVLAGVGRLGSIGETIIFSPAPLVLAVAFAVLAWYIVLGAFFTSASSSSADLSRALVNGTLISAGFAMVTAALALAGLLHGINIC